MSKFLVGLMLGLGVAFAACDEPLNVKAWFSNGTTGFVRKQANEFLPYNQSKGYIAYSPDDHTAIQTRYALCQEELKKCKQ